MTPDRYGELAKLAESLAARRGAGPSEAVRLMAELMLELLRRIEELEKQCQSRSL